MTDTDGLGERLVHTLAQTYMQLDEGREIAISPALVAQRAYAQIDPTQQAPPLARWAAILELRQMARAICRKRIEEDDAPSRQGQLFSGQLQQRYPARRNGQDMYVLREHLTLDERRHNIARLRSVVEAVSRHADALQSETDALLARGYFERGRAA